MKSQEEEEEKEDSSFSENGIQSAEGVADPRMCTHTLTHTLKHTQIYIYICVCVALVLQLFFTRLLLGFLLVSGKKLRNGATILSYNEIDYTG